MGPGDGGIGHKGQHAEAKLTGGKGLRSMGGNPFLATAEEVAEYMALCVRDKCPLLDGSAVKTLLSGVTAWHELPSLASDGAV